MKSLLLILSPVALATSALAQAPALAVPNEPVTAIAPEPAEPTLVSLEWRVVSQSAITEARAFSNLNAGTRNDRQPASMPISIEPLDGAVYALRVELYAHPYHRAPWQFFPPLPQRSLQSWYLEVANADGRLVTNEIFLLVIPKEHGAAFQLAK